MTFKICTWNTRGDPTQNQGKRAVLDALWRDCDFVLLQECGNLADRFRFGTPDIAHAEQAGAFNIRCSTAIISKHGWASEEQVYLPSGTGRSAIVANFNGFAIATLHAISGGVGAQDLAPLAQMLSRQGPYVIGGDFNVSVDSAALTTTRRQIVMGSERTRLTPFYKAPALPSHTGGNRLDYFVYEGVIMHDVQRYMTTGGSDHYPVIGYFG